MKFTISKEVLRRLADNYIINHGTTNDFESVEKKAYKHGYIDCLNEINKILDKKNKDNESTDI